MADTNHTFEGYATVRSIVRGFSRARRAWRFVRECGTYVSVSLCALLAWCLADYLLPLPSVLVLGGLGLAGVAVLGGLAWWLVVVLRRRESLHWEAVHIEQLHGSLDNRLIGTLQLVEEARRSRGGAVGYSLQLVDALARSTAAFLHGEDVRRLIDRRRPARAAALGGVLALTAALLCVFISDFVPGRIASVKTSYRRVVESLWPVTLTASPGDAQALRGEDSVTLGVRVEGRFYETVRLLAKDDSGNVLVDEELPLRGAEPVRTAEKLLPAETVAEVAKFFTYQFTAGEHTGNTHTIRVVDRPHIENMSAELRFPSYTQMPPQQITGIFSSIRALQGTQVLLSLAANKPLSRAMLVFGGDESAPQPMDISGRFAVTQFSIDANQEAELRVVCEDGYAMARPLRFNVEALADNPPEVSILMKREERPLLRDEVKAFSFAYVASDDYGIAQVQIHYSIEGVREELARDKREGEFEPLSFPRPERKMRGVMKKPFAKLDVEPGDRVTFWLTAVDNNTKTGPGIARSDKREFVVVLPDLARYNQPEFDWAMRRSLLLGALKKVRRNTDFLKLPERRVSAEDTVPPPKHKLAAHVPPEGWPAGVEQAVTDYLRLLSTHGKQED